MLNAIVVLGLAAMALLSPYMASAYSPKFNAPVAGQDIGPCGYPSVLKKLRAEEGKILHFYGADKAKRGPIEVDWVNDRELVCFSSYEFESATLQFAYRITQIRGSDYRVVIDPKSIRWEQDAPKAQAQTTPKDVPQGKTHAPPPPAAQTPAPQAPPSQTPRTTERIESCGHPFVEEVLRASLAPSPVGNPNHSWLFLRFSNAGPRETRDPKSVQYSTRHSEPGLLDCDVTFFVKVSDGRETIYTYSFTVQTTDSGRAFARIY